MAIRHSSLCIYPSCKDRAVDRGRCAFHGALDRKRLEELRPSSLARGFDRAWRKLRAQVLREEPWCRRCGRESTEVDHRIPRSQGGTDDRENLQGVCKPCHSRKGAKEGRWGRS